MALMQVEELGLKAWRDREVLCCRQWEACSFLDRGGTDGGNRLDRRWGKGTGREIGGETVAGM